MVCLMLQLTFGTKLVFSSRVSLQFEAAITLVAFTPDASMVEHTDSVELTATVDAFHHSEKRGREGGEGGGKGEG